jgi:ElaB/YqjD/DUF883 family membrane-anchored ribosome-binding protein
MDTKETVGNGKTTHATVVHEWTPVDESGLHKNTEQIEHDIDETRHTMDMILDALSGKVSPNTMYRRAVHYFQSRENRENVRKSLSDVADNITGSFQRNPLPIMMVAAGAAWMLWETQRDGRYIRHDGYAREQFENVKGEAGERLHQVRDKVSEQAGVIQGKAHEAADVAHARAGEFKDKAREAYYSAKDRAASALGGTRQKGDEFRQRAAEMQGSAYLSARRAGSAVHDNPLLFGFAAAFAGIVAGLILPETKSERDIAGEKAATIIEKSEEKGAELSQTTTRAVSEKAEQTGIAGEQLKQKVKETVTEGEKTAQLKAKEEAGITQKTVKPDHPVRNTETTFKKPDEKSSQQKGSVN